MIADVEWQHPPDVDLRLDFKEVVRAELSAVALQGAKKAQLPFQAQKRFGGVSAGAPRYEEKNRGVPCGKRWQNELENHNV